jgi:Chalcone isomerase-like
MKPHAPLSRRHAVALLLATALPSARAQLRVPDELSGEWAAPRLHGQGRLRFFGLHVYDIRLWSGSPALAADEWPRAPLALEIEYARSLVGKLIAERSLEEMQRSGPIAPEQAERWLATMTQLFPDVNKGDRITGVQRPGAAARFFVNGKLRGEVREAEFARRFFGIWLAPATSEPALRAALLGTS